MCLQVSSPPMSVLDGGPGIEAWTPPGFSGRPFWAGPLCFYPDPQNPPVVFRLLPQQQDGPSWV